MGTKEQEFEPSQIRNLEKNLNSLTAQEKRLASGTRLPGHDSLNRHQLTILFSTRVAWYRYQLMDIMDIRSDTLEKYRLFRYSPLGTGSGLNQFHIVLEKIIFSVKHNFCKSKYSTVFSYKINIFLFMYVLLMLYLNGYRSPTSA